MTDKPTENGKFRYISRSIPHHNSHLIFLDVTIKAAMAKIYDESHKNNNSKTPKKSVTSIAKRRWKILAKALCHGSNSYDESETENNSPIQLATNQSNLIASDDYLASVRRFTCFSLFQRNSFIVRRYVNEDIQSAENWFVYRTNVDSQEYSLVVHELSQKFTPENLIGFNNTGNICIWPSEEALAFYILHHLPAFHQRRVLELGGGMTCLASLLIAKYTKADFVHLTDGNDLSCANANEMLAQNIINSANVMCSVLKWETVVDVQDDAQYDCIISADCLFFDSARTSFVNALWLFMKPTGFGLIMAPNRGNTLNIFLRQATQKGFHCQVRKYYNRIIWQKHLELLDTSVYDEDIHYPVLIEVTKLSVQNHVPIIPVT